MNIFKNNNLKRHLIIGASVLTLSFTVSCSSDDDAPTTNGGSVDNGFLASQLDELEVIDLDGFVIPDTYDIEGVFAPGVYSGQEKRIAQLKEITAVLKDNPIEFDLADALANGNNTLFSNIGLSDTNIRTKIDELNFDNNYTSVADDFQELADALVETSQGNGSTTAANGTAGVLDGRHFSANGLEYAQILEKGLFGALFYDQIADDYLSDTQAGDDNPLGNNEDDAGTDYDTEGTSRQHSFDEAFGYFGANPTTYPNISNTSNGDGDFIANYTFDRSDDTEDAFGINLAQKAMDAYITGRAALKAGEGQSSLEETTNETVFNAARADIILYVESGIAATAFHYLNSSIADVEDADKLHHLSEALAFIYSLSFNSEGLIDIEGVQDVLEALGWDATLDADSGMISMDGIYNLNLWDVTDAQMEAAIAELEKAYPGFSSVGF